MNNKVVATVILLMSLAGCDSSSSDDNTEVVDDNPIAEEPSKDTFVDVTLISITGDDNVPSFEMSQTEVTNEQYVKFLNEAHAEGAIRYDLTEKMVYDIDDNAMINLAGTRVVKDHNKDGVYVLDEMENPLNRSMIEYNEETELFQVVDPLTVDWSIYFDPTTFSNVVDTINDWAELNEAGTGFYGEGDEDKLLPTVDEIKTWPVNHIRYYGALGFAKFYGYELPSKAQWRYAGQAGVNFEHATSDGTVNEGIAWFNIVGPPTIHKGHVQPALSKEPNPYGIYNLGGNVWEWCKDWYDGYTVFGGPAKLDEDFFVDDTITYDESVGNYLKCLLGGSFNFFDRTLSVTWNHAALPLAGNDHFGFRVVKNN